MFSLVEFADRLRQVRRACGLNQTAFGELGGVGLQTQSRYEKAETEPGASYLANLGNNGIDVTYILLGQRSAALIEADASDLLGQFDLMTELQRASLVTFLQALHPSRELRVADTLPAPTMHDGKSGYRGEGE